MTDTGTFVPRDRTKTLDTYFKFTDIEPSHGLVFTINESLTLKTARNSCGSLNYWTSIDMQVVVKIGDTDPFHMYKDDMVTIDGLTTATAPVHFKRIPVIKIGAPRAVNINRGTANETVKFVTEFLVSDNPPISIVKWEDVNRPSSGNHVSGMFLKTPSLYNRLFELSTARASTIIPEEASITNFNSQNGVAFSCVAYYVYTTAPDVPVTQAGLEFYLPTDSTTLLRTALLRFAEAKPEISPVPVRAYVHANCACFNGHHANVRIRVRVAKYVRVAYVYVEMLLNMWCSFNTQIA